MDAMGSLRLNLLYCSGLFMGAAVMGLACDDMVKAACVGAMFAGTCFMLTTAIDLLRKRGRQ